MQQRACMAGPRISSYQRARELNLREYGYGEIQTEYKGRRRVIVNEWKELPGTKRAWEAKATYKISMMRDLNGKLWVRILQLDYMGPHCIKIPDDMFSEFIHFIQEAWIESLEIDDRIRALVQMTFEGNPFNRLKHIRGTDSYLLGERS